MESAQAETNNDGSLIISIGETYRLYILNGVDVEYFGEDAVCDYNLNDDDIKAAYAMTDGYLGSYSETGTSTLDISVKKGQLKILNANDNGIQYEKINQEAVHKLALTKGSRVTISGVDPSIDNSSWNWVTVFMKTYAATLTRTHYKDSIQGAQYKDEDETAGSWTTVNYGQTLVIDVTEGIVVIYFTNKGFNQIETSISNPLIDIDVIYEPYELKESTIHLSVGETYQLEKPVSRIGNVNHVSTFHAENYEIADIDYDSGVITAHSEGSTVIIVSTMCWGDTSYFYQKCNVIVGDKKEKNKAIYVLPGYMGSRLYMNGVETWSNSSFLEEDIYNFFLPTKTSQFLLQADGSGSKMYVDDSKDKYGTNNEYEALMTKLEDEFEEEYAVHFFPYNWLGDINDSAERLENHINSNQYEKVVLVTHSTGGLLASAYIARSKENQLKVKKAILLAPPLNGTYTALQPVETGKTNEMDDMLRKEGISNDYGIKYPLIYQWVKAVTKNSPTTYQLLPNEDYLATCPLINRNGNKGVGIVSTSKYYQILNESNNINSNLTNGNDRSHKAFRNTALKGNIVSVLQKVDTIVYGSDYCDKDTPATVVYSNQLFGGTKLTDIQFSKNGDGTVLKNSTFGISKDFKQVLKYRNYSGYDHGELKESSRILTDVCKDIENIDWEEDTDSSVQQLSTASMFENSGTESGMTQTLKLNMEYPTGSLIQILDNANNVVAQISEEEILGFEENTFSYWALSEDEEKTTAIICMPNQGYKIEFFYGEEADTDIEFICTISTLDYDGFKTSSATYINDKTTENGLITCLNATDLVTVSSIGLLSEGETIEPSIFNTDWELPDSIKLELNEIENTLLLGSDLETIKSSLQWETSDDTVVSVASDGTITSVGYGNAIVSATDGNKVDSTYVTVMLNATQMTLHDVIMVPEERFVIEPEFFPANSTEMNVNYSVSEDGIISIDEFGVITALKNGTTTVTGITDYGVSDSFIVTVSSGVPVSVESVKIEPEKTSINVGGQETLRATFIPLAPTNSKLIWDIADKSIASITNVDGQNCIVKGLKKGNTKVTVITDDGGYTATATITVMDDDSNNNIVTIIPTPTPQPSVKVNEKFISSNMNYTVTNVGSSNTVKLNTTTSKNVTSVTIPSTVSYKGKSFKVTAVADKAFINCKKLKSINFGNTITKIGKSTCEGNTALTTVSIGKKVKSIGDRAFLNCSKLSKVTNTGAVTTIGTKSFYGNKALTSLPSFAKLQKIGKNAFQNCTGLKTVSIKDTVTTIESDAFRGCTNLTKFTTSTKSKLKTIGVRAFYENKALKSVYLRGKNLKTVSSKAFTGGYAKMKFYLLKSKSKAYQKLLNNKVPSKKIYKTI